MTSNAFVEDLLSTHRRSASPWLTWYAANGERIELSGRVFDNWVAKSANMLSEVFSLEEGDVVVLNLSSHWKSLVLALASLHHGATLVPAGSGLASSAALWITDAPNDEQIPASAEILAVNPAALALSFGEDLGPVAEDFNASVRTYADQFYPSAVDENGLAIDADGTGELSIQSLFTADATAQGTILVRADIPVLELLPYAVAQWAAGDAIVLLGDGVEATQRLREGERITFDYLP
ncbi:TIGR03089 family protein [Glutamicibacter sp.]|uniref:TIGR03089 family protein n=1 Tax=Glutamicibacter sp. TaxID=1931995 RepID=UPI0028BE2629|nr:TIGR03089 family protein [Glutamicibacter sp.]